MNRTKSFQELVGRTITAVEDSSCNMVHLTLDNGHTLTVEAVNVQSNIGLIGIDLVELPSESKKFM